MRQARASPDKYCTHTLASQCRHKQRLIMGQFLAIGSVARGWDGEEMRDGDIISRQRTTWWVLFLSGSCDSWWTPASLYYYHTNVTNCYRILDNAVDLITGWTLMLLCNECQTCSNKYNLLFWPSEKTKLGWEKNEMMVAWPEKYWIKLFPVRLSDRKCLRVPIVQYSFYFYHLIFSKY